MNVLLDLQHKIRTNTAAIGRLESAFVHQPESSVIQANLRSLRKLQSNLTEEFDIVLRAAGMDVCSYRLLDDRPSARALSKSLIGFQETFSTVFESLRSGPMPRRIVPKDTLRLTELRVAYTFPGSFGVVLVVPRDNLLFEEWPTKADEAIDIVFGVTRSRSSKALSQIAHQLGRAPIAALYGWAKDNAQNKVGAGVEWNPDGKSTRSLFVQYPEFDELSKSIEETSEEQVTVGDFLGSLVGADTKTRRFHFVTEDDRDLRGRFVDAISESQKAELPAKYVATVQSKVKVNFATGEDESSYDLLRLTPVAQ